MAKSEFLEYQDSNNDGLIDACEEVIEVAPAPDCPTCLPNPSALLPDWTTLTQTEPFLNEKNCMYQVAVATGKRTTGYDDGMDEDEAQSALEGVFNEFQETAIDALLLYYSKDTSAASKEIAQNAIEYTDYDLPAKPISYLKLLYSIPYDDFNQIPTEEEETIPGEEEIGAIEVTYTATEFLTFVRHVRQALRLYTTYFKIYRAVDGGNLYYLSGPKTDSPFNLETYGGKQGLLNTAARQLDTFLNGRGYNIPGNLRGGMFKDRVEKLTFTFGDNYDLKKLTIYTEECGEKAIIFRKGSKLDLLLSQSAFKDQTVLGYLAQLSEMDTDLTARSPSAWLEFVMKYTYPALYDTTNQGYANTDPENSIGNCIADALENEAKQMGQDILDEVFGLPQAIAQGFGKRLCATEEEREKIERELGLIYAKRRIDNPDDPDGMTIEGDKDRLFADNLYAMAQEQAFGKIGVDDDPWQRACAGYALKDIDELYGLLDELAFCGLTDLMMSGIQCLFQGMSFEDALGTMLQSGLRAMSVENFDRLFVGLPPEKQAELNILATEKLSDGSLFKEGSGGQQLSDRVEGLNATTASGSLDASTTETTETVTPGDLTAGNTGTMTDPEVESELSRRTLARQFQIYETGKQTFSKNSIGEAYILALLEVYNDDLLSLLDEMNKFPGAPLVAATFAAIDCPLPPIFEPSLMDWFKSIDLPICDHQPVVAPIFHNPFEWIAEQDPLDLLMKAAKAAINQMIVNILNKLLMRLCNLIGSAVCQALEALGDAAASLVDAGCAESISDVIRDSICGEAADQEQINSTVINMLSSMGMGSAALADESMLLSFAEDLSCISTKQELANAFLGDISQDFASLADQLIEFEYPEYRAALPNAEAIGGLFKNMGNLMPADFRDTLGQVLGDESPVNPSLCLTPEKVEEFCEMRSALLEGRASPAQLADLCPDNTAALGDLADALEDPLPFDADMISDPGCDNGIFPYEPEESIAATTSGLGNTLEQLKVAFSYDMLGNGPGPKRWGLINMMMSDTMGIPLTAHYRRVANRKSYVDFYNDNGIGLVDGVKAQEGAFPYKIADWLQDYMKTLNVTYSSNNDVEARTFAGSEELDTGKLFAPKTDPLKLPELGYNITTIVDIENNKLKRYKEARKKTPDVTLQFRDNAAGTGQSFAYGFDMGLYLADLAEVDGQYANVGTSTQLPADTVRIKITDVINNNANMDNSLETLKEEKDKKEEKGEAQSEFLKYEFLSYDDTFRADRIPFTALDSYTAFLQTFYAASTHAPQIILLREILNLHGGSYTDNELKPIYESFMGSLMNTFISEVANNEEAFLYGAQFDDLTFEDIQYVTTNGEPYEDYRNEEGDKLTNADQVLGISYDQYLNEKAGTPENTRIFYLDPNIYGGNYKNPPIYVKPMENKGWLGLIDVMFPELSPCKPYRTDLIDFQDIQEKISNSYPYIPEDERLKYDPDCVIEVPYNRILERASVAGLEGLIAAAIRIYASVHFVKSMATFTKFYPDFDNVISPLYASFIIEDMEKSFKDAQKAAWEFLNPFSDHEFWYAFLEQSVQLYGRRIDSDDITEVPQDVQEALSALNDMQAIYHYPTKQNKKAEGGFLKTMKEFREEKNLQAIQATEEHAKLILKELVKEQLTFMGDIFLQNLGQMGISPSVYDLDYYLLTELTQGSNLTLNQAIQEVTEDLPSDGEGYYTSGGNFTTPDGETYVGYYHVNIDENGYTIYMTGETHISDEHDTLTPVAKEVTIPIGDVESYSVTPLPDATKPFVIEKYISINGEKYAPATAIEMIKQNSSELNISDVYPGTLAKVYAPASAGGTTGEVIGLSGELGVRYGLQFSMAINGDKIPVTTAEVDALDYTVAQIQPFDGDSKLLLCLINMLKEDTTFRLISQYIFPLRKIVATTAIYNDLGFLPSIGEVVVEDGEATGGSKESKPGMYVEFQGDVAVTYAGGPGWASYNDRAVGWLGDRMPPLEWDNWDQVLLRNSKSRIKKIFKDYYRARDFNPSEAQTDSPGQMITSNFRDSLKPPAGLRLLPRWKKRMLRTNPFNASGALCEKKD